MKDVALDGGYVFGFEAIPHPSFYLNSIMDKTRHGPVIALFFVKLQQLFSLRLKYPCINQPFFHCLLFDMMIGSYILAIQQMITHKEHLQHSF